MAFFVPPASAEDRVGFTSPDGGVACQDFMNGKGFSMSGTGYQLY